MAKESDVLNYFDIPIEHFPDRSARWLFEDPENVRGLLEIVSGELVERIEFSQITQLKRSFIRDDLRELESDLVFSVPFRNVPKTEELLIYILIEHQSTVDSTMAFRLLFYMTQIWDSQRREWNSNNVPKSEWRFRPILPIVFYTAAQEWNAPLNLDAIMDTPAVLSRFVPNFEPLFLGVKHTDEADLTKTDHPFGWLLTVMQKEHAEKEALTSALMATMSRINALNPEQAQQGRRAILYLLLLILHRRPAEEHGELRTLVEQQVQQPIDREEVETMAQTMAEHLIERGETRAKQVAVVKLLRLRFHSVPESVTNEISSIQSLSRLDSLFEKAATVKTLDEIDFQNHDA